MQARGRGEGGGGEARGPGGGGRPCERTLARMTVLGSRTATVDSRLLRNGEPRYRSANPHNKMAISTFSRSVFTHKKKSSASDPSASAPGGDRTATLSHEATPLPYPTCSLQTEFGARVPDARLACCRGPRVRSECARTSIVPLVALEPVETDLEVCGEVGSSSDLDGTLLVDRLLADDGYDQGGCHGRAVMYVADWTHRVLKWSTSLNAQA